MNDKLRQTYNTNDSLKFENMILNSSLCGYIDVYVLVKGTISVANTAAGDENSNNTNKKVIFVHHLLNAYSS